MNHTETGAGRSNREQYDEGMTQIRAAFQAGLRRPDSGLIAIRARAELVDAMLRKVWLKLLHANPSLSAGVAVVAVGGYGRSELFPYSDVDVLLLLEAKSAEKMVKDPARLFSQLLWDSGLRVSAMVRTLADCEKFDQANVEFTLSLFDARHVAGDTALTSKLTDKSLPKVIARDRKNVVARLLDVTRTRHAKYGDTLFHLEPNIKECPGGLRDAHVCAWLERLSPTPAPPLPPQFAEAREFLLLVRAFLHFRHGRDDNTLDWQIQDEAAAAALAVAAPPAVIAQLAAAALQPGVDAAYWMRLYFRQARAIERAVSQAMEEATPVKTSFHMPLLASLRGHAVDLPQRGRELSGFELRGGRIDFSAAALDEDAGADLPDLALSIFAEISRAGASLSREAEARLEQAVPVLSSSLNDGAHVWNPLEAILTGPFAGRALRAMHELGILELLIPEFHGIDALVIRDAYHRYTVDEHTFVLIDTLHALRAGPRRAKGESARGPTREPGREPERDLREASFAALLRDLPNPALLFLAALLHDTGKGHAGAGHAQESARMADGVLDWLALDPYEATLVLDLIRNHLEMSAALRRDVFDIETIRAFAARVQTPEALRMLTLFTWADIRAVHPDALTPWKAENLWNLYMATSNFLDRSVDEERVASSAESRLGEIVQSLWARHARQLAPELQAEIAHYLEGFPRRYLQTRVADVICLHAEMAAKLGQEAIQLDFRFQPASSELTLVTHDRPGLFADVAGVLAAWGMNIVTADAFSNNHGIVVDSFRFTDTFRTLELNEPERARFVQSVQDAMTGKVGVETLLAARRRGRRKTPKITVETRIDMDAAASTHSTLLQVVAQDTPGLLRALSLTIARHGCNIEVALIDTEGEMAIDVFYLTRGGSKLETSQSEALQSALVEAMEENAR